MHVPALSLVLPVYNEARILERSLAAIVACLEGLELAQGFEIVAVDDGSRDASRAILEAFRAREPRLRVVALAQNGGKGGAVRRGVLEARGRQVLFMDADLSVPLEEVRPLLEALREHDVALGSRRAPGARITRHQPWLRETLGRCFTALARALLAARGIHDFTCGFKAFRAEAAERIFRRVTQRGWAFDAEVVVIARELGLRIAQVPVAWRHEDGSKVRVGSAVLRSLREVARIRSNQVRGLYR